LVGAPGQTKTARLSAGCFVWYPWVDTYRTRLVAPGVEARLVLTGVREHRAAG